MDFQIIQARRSGIARTYNENDISVTLSYRSEHKSGNSYSFRVVVGAKVDNAPFYVFAKASSGEMVFIPSEKGYKFLPNSGGNTKVMRMDLTENSLSAFPDSILSKVKAEGTITLNATIDNEKRIWINA